MLSRAITRRPATTYHRGITSQRREGANHARALLQHAAYVTALENAGLQVTVLEALEAHPDAHFVEDAAVILGESTVLTRPGALSRRGEPDALAAVLARGRSLQRIEAPGTLDGGDVLALGRHVLIGVSQRTNEHGAKQLTEILRKQGYRTESLEVRDGLHLKSSVNAIGEASLIVTRALADHPALSRYARLAVDPAEEYAANVLWINDRLLLPAGYPATVDRLVGLGMEIVELEMGEARRMDGGLTCLSIRF